MDILSALRSCSTSGHQSVVSTFLLLFCFLSPSALLTVFLQVVQVELAGNDASKYEKETDNKMASWMIILLTVAGAVGLFVMLLACCCVSCTSLLYFQSYYSSYDF